jgi:D-inositol-3-phosphate glycosyltransferase
MLARSAVITSRLGGPIDYIVHGENGLLVEPNDPADLANALDRLLASPELHKKIIHNGRKTAEGYSLDRMARGYARVIARTKKGR